MSIEVFPLPPSGPSLAEITSAITSNAAPATVTMPAITSSITTNAASSGVTMAAITSAITTNAASSGVTLAAIGTQVANNASPYGGTWADLGSYSTANGSTVTFSNLGGYKYLRFLYIVNPSTTQVQRLRFNGDSGATNYAWANNANNQSNNYSSGDAQFDLSIGTASANFAVFEIKNSNNTSSLKQIYSLVNGVASLPASFVGVWKSTAAITSLTFFVTSGNWQTVYIHLLGAN